MKPPISDKIVAIGLLTQHDLDVLGTGFRRLFPVEQGMEFADLLARLDQADRPTELGPSGVPAGSAD